MGCKSRFNSTLILESRNRPITVPIGKQVLIKFKELRFGVREEVVFRSYIVQGYAAIIIQNSAGSGNAVEYNKSVLTHSTLLASVRMPIDLFVGKSSVQTHIYVFRIGEAHQKDDIVKFIDFSNDGYTRSSRKKSTNNLRDTDNAKERYQELVNLVRFGKSKMSIFTEQDYYEGVIDPENGADWNQTSPIDTKPTVEDFKKTVSDYLAWEVSTLLKNQPSENERLGK